MHRSSYEWDEKAATQSMNEKLYQFDRLHSLE